MEALVEAGMMRALTTKAQHQNMQAWRTLHPVSCPWHRLQQLGMMRLLRQRRQQLLFLLLLWQQQQQRRRRRRRRLQGQMGHSKAKSRLERLQRLRLRQGRHHHLHPLRHLHRRRQPLMVGRRRRCRERGLPRHRQGDRSAARLVGRRHTSRVSRQRGGMQISPSG